MFDGIADFFENIQKGMAMPPSAATLAKQKKVRSLLVLRGNGKSAHVLLSTLQSLLACV